MQKNGLQAGATRSADRTRRLVYISLFGALGAVMTYIQMPVFFAPPFYELEVSDIPILLSGFTFGPWTGAVTALVKILLKLAVKPTSTAFVGELSQLFTTVSLVVVASAIYQKNRTRKGAGLGLLAGVLVMTLLNVFSNAYVMLPTYAAVYGMPIETLIGMGTAVNPAIHNLLTFVAFAVAPFNLLKGGLQAFVTLLLYKGVSTVLHGTR